MPRSLRTDAPGVTHHVMIRGVNGHAIFSSSSEFEDFLARFALLTRELRFLVLAWCLIGNHGHFVLEQLGEVSLGTLMARLTARHAQRFNRMHARTGHLFGGRYEAVHVESDRQRVATIPYVLGNLVRHGLGSMEQLAEYPWSGYGALVGARRPRTFESLEETARALGAELRVLPELVAAAAQDVALRDARLEPDQIAELDRLIRACCRRHHVDERLLRAQSHRARSVRREAVSLAAVHLNLSLVEIARHLGIPYATAWRIRARAGAR